MIPATGDKIIRYKVGHPHYTSGHSIDLNGQLQYGLLLTPSQKRIKDELVRNEYTTTLQNALKPCVFSYVQMVEAAGVEPASENAASKEPTYLVDSRAGYPALSPAALRTNKKRGRPA